MKHQEFYRKYKTSYAPIENPIFPRNWWRIILATGIAVLIEPVIFLYKSQRLSSLSLDSYLEILKYFLLIVVPFLAYVLWVNWKEWIKRSRGYGWVGKFEVAAKQSSLAFCYLLLVPGEDNKIRVSRDLFGKIRAGDFVEIRRDALGSVDEITKVKNFSSRLTKSLPKQSKLDRSTKVEAQRKQG